MATSNVQESAINDYEYMNENAIDCELKCPLCMQPFQKPVGAACGHTFCHGCIRQWITRQTTCPTCRTTTSAEDFHPISTRIVLNQLERLLLRCKRCNQANIQRGSIREHEQQCVNQIVSCPQFDIKCTWKGRRNDLDAHLAECAFRKIRPAIDDVYEHLKNIYEPLVNELQVVRQELEKQMQRNNERQRFLLAVFNRGKPMSETCTNGHGRYCYLQTVRGNSNRNQMMQYDVIQGSQQMPRSPMEQMMGQMSRDQMEFYPPQNPNSPIVNRRTERSQNRYERDVPTNSQLCCASCQNNLDYMNVSLHHCAGGCICRICVETYGTLDL